MEHKHLDFDDLLQASYGGMEIECRECSMALAAMTARRREPRAEDSLPEWFWLRQQGTILEAAQRPTRSRWLGIAAMAGVLAAAALSIQPAPRATVPAQISAEDLRLFEEVSITVNRVEPRAMEPMSILWAP